ncbi:hypothetical protein B0H94_103194 [Salsuginibacillus halophilus]|uniref:Putative membrane protein insertion efficiency factor n=1 Tax=Salsuginibacillus halophilus TaxID=517424 RepID=A0A2P8HWI4_9BACI|nr:membrane protein insertion efficiency factor YidD [Salsuginibacillus halophilus]PSL50582.1 hypothetical protein B0H94_103194 [Salsuginibacillus halophilus]
MLKKTAVVIIRGYQRFISPIKPPTCRFYPTCSQYGLEAFQKHSFIKAFWLTLKRIMKCQPFHPGGVDHVPPVKTKKDRRDEPPRST